MDSAKSVRWMFVAFVARDATFIPVPYDCDLSGIVDAPHARPSSRPNIDRVTEHVDRGIETERAAIDANLAALRSRRDAILDLWTNTKPLSDDFGSTRPPDSRNPSRRWRTLTQLQNTTRGGKGLDPSAVRMILLLPVSVAGLVLIVQNSLALAFSLAGLIAGAGVRFRIRVKTMSDTLFFMVAISIGLASGVGALGIAAMMSLIFCYATLVIDLREGAEVAQAGEGKPKDDED